ncbi:hypothetical protein AAES_102393 [Amazona aestiva]|uniref:Uncharacterized protein n=1 Tax=Amazona aestiva TaxID=12930 RepID=A0A0Q3PFH8_AMAAE|nr:hypothetical protein AAES_102393 [Amazona aestiva]
MRIRAAFLSGRCRCLKCYRGGIVRERVTKQWSGLRLGPARQEQAELGTAGRQAVEGKEIPRDKLHRQEDAQMFEQINQARICKILGGNTKVLC